MKNLSKVVLGLFLGIALTFGVAQVSAYVSESLGALDGSAGSPAFYFHNDTDNGLYRSAANTWHLVGGGVAVAQVDATGFRLQGATVLSLANGTAALPSLPFQSDLDTGIFRPAANSIGFSAGGTEVARFDGSNDLVFRTDASHAIYVETQDTAATAGNPLALRGGEGNTTGNGGTLTMTGGLGGATSGIGGVASLIGGAGRGTGAGGAANHTGGAGGGGATGAAGGAVNLTGGLGGTASAAAGGLATVIGGGGGGLAGDASDGGGVAITGGAATAVDGDGGAVTITGGTAVAGGGTEDGGAVIINGGDGADNDGLVLINSVATSRGVRLGATSPMNITNIRIYTLTNVDLDTADNAIADGACALDAAQAVAGILATDNLIVTTSGTDLGVEFQVVRSVPTTDVITFHTCNDSAAGGADDPGAVWDARVVAISGS